MHKFINLLSNKHIQKNLEKVAVTKQLYLFYYIKLKTRDLKLLGQKLNKHYQ